MASFTLPPLLPPLRFAIVEEGVYRGAYPSLVNLRFLQRLQLRTVVSLLPEAPTPDLLSWCHVPPDTIALRVLLHQLFVLRKAATVHLAHQLKVYVP